MPELPDVENFRRFLERTALRRTVTGVSVCDDRILHGDSPAALRKAVEGRRLERTRRHGKHLLAGLDNGRWLTFHFGMTGRFETFRDEPPRSTRVRFDFREGDPLAFVDQRLFGGVGVTENARAFVEAHELGPDALEISEDEFSRTVLGGSRNLKAALMDQAKIAGIGNEYSDEILFQARLHPEMRTNALDREQISRLYRIMREVLEKAIEAGAGTREFDENPPADFLIAHRRKGASCPRCGTPLQTKKSAGRTAWFCPRCQPAPA
ncbi:MAG: DNA-formamidopyrimidine glycosylase [Alphaproteobacteria bacterium]